MCLKESMLKRFKSWLKTRRFKVKSVRERKKQEIWVETRTGMQKALKDGGGLRAEKMLQQAIQARYLPNGLREREIINWANQLKQHWIAAEIHAQGGVNKVNPKIIKAIDRKINQLIMESLRKVGLKG